MFSNHFPLIIINSMVFFKLSVGLLTGVTIPFLVNEMTYMTIANSFLRPHLKFKIQRDNLEENKAIPTQMLDAYVKDAVGSFLMFFVVIGPVIYESYFKAKQAEAQAPKREEVGNMEDDKYTKMLKQIKSTQVNKIAEERQVAPLSLPESRISFEEYEAFLRRLDEEGRLDKLEVSNPRSVRYLQEAGSRGEGNK